MDDRPTSEEANEADGVKEGGRGLRCTRQYGMREPCTVRNEWWNVQADDGKMETAKTATPPVWLGKEPAERASASVSKVLASQGETSRSLLSKTGFEGRLLLFFVAFCDFEIFFGKPDDDDQEKWESANRSEV